MSGLWGVGTMPDGSILPLSVEDIERDTAAASRALRGLGIAAGHHVLLISRNSQAGQIWPVLAALISCGAVYSPVDPSGFEARRVEMYLRRLPFYAVVGVTDEIIDGLDELGLDAAKVLAQAPVVLAVPSAARRLRRDGLAAARLLFLGPTLAMDCPAAQLHVDGQVWDLADRDGRLVVAPRQARAAWPAGQCVATGVVGTVGIGRCDCGRDDPWLVAGDLEVVPTTDGT
jgi:hypothetical protein